MSARDAETQKARFRTPASVHLLALAGALSASAPATFASPPPLTLPDIHGQPVTPLSCASTQKAAVILFITTECPIANAYAPEIARIAKEFAPRGIRFTLAHVDPSLTDARARDHAREYGLENIGIVNDRAHALVAAAQATTTPEAAVFSPQGTLLYHGRISNLYAALGDKRAKATVHDLRDALDAVLAGDPVKHAHTAPVGCLIEPLD